MLDPGSGRHSARPLQGGGTVGKETSTVFELAVLGLLVNCVDCVGSLRPGVRTMLDVIRVHSVGV